jgi:Domain of Unknown Function (DUF1080)
MRIKYIPLFIVLLAISACTSTNKLSKSEEKAGWKLLFDGKTTNGWHNFNQKGVTGWAVKDGQLIALSQGSNDIVSDLEYENFELMLEWKVSPGGNSGVFFNVVESPKYSAVYATGPEYQLVDDIGFPEKLEGWQKSGANYGMHPPLVNALKPIGEFNSTRIVVNKGHVEHWLNGQKTAEYQLWTPEWKALLKSGKWKDFPDYGLAKRGHLALQDHGKMTWFKNIKIRAL